MIRLAFAAAILAGMSVPAAAGEPAIRLSGAEATVVDGSGATVMTVKQGDPAFARIGNPKAVVIDGDAFLRRVRVSGFGQAALWIRCSELGDIPGYCDRAVEDERAAGEAKRAAQVAAELRARAAEAEARASQARAASTAAAEAERRARIGAVRGAPSDGPDERGVPVCPGDPRCP